LEDTLISIAAFMAGTKQQPPAPAPAPAPLSMEQQFAAFVAAQQWKEAPKDQSAIDKAVARALESSTTRVAEEVADLVAIVEQTGLASQANAVSSTASPMDATSLTTDQHARKRRLGTVIQQPTLTQAWERCGTRISTPDQAAYNRGGVKVIKGHSW
jgi:hypothetical protein